MSESLISVTDFAQQHGKRKQTVFKILKRFGIETQKLRSSNHRGQLISYITLEESRLVANELFSPTSQTKSHSETDIGLPEALLDDQGVFYLVLLEPNHDPGRFKVGFATSLSERLRALRCSAPFIKVIGTWTCKRLWEKTVIDCVTDGCERLHTEVVRTLSIDAVLQRCEKFFDLMPKL